MPSEDAKQQAPQNPQQQQQPPHPPQPAKIDQQQSVQTLVSPISIPIAESYFSIPQDLEILENITVLDYLRDHVWLSSARQKKCEIVFSKLTKYNSSEWRRALDELEKGISQFLNSDHAGVLLPTVFLGVGLVDLFDFPATHQNMTGLLKCLEHDKLRFREIDFRTWCGISAFAERMVLAEPLKCENLEIADFNYLKKYGDWYEIPPGLRNVFDIVQKSHKNYVTL